MKIYTQKECNYRHIQEAVKMLPSATRELDSAAQPDALRAISTITHAVTGANPSLFFAVAEIDGQTAGFMAGALATYLLEGRTLAQDILLYVAPEHRSGGVASALIQAFAAWGREQGANEVRMFLMNPATEAAMTSIVETLGFQRSGTVFTQKNQVT